MSATVRRNLPFSGLHLRLCGLQVCDQQKRHRLRNPKTREKLDTPVADPSPARSNPAPFTYAADDQGLVVMAIGRPVLVRVA